MREKSSAVVDLALHESWRGLESDHEQAKRSGPVHRHEWHVLRALRSDRLGVLAHRVSCATRYATAKCLKPGCCGVVSFDTTRDVKSKMKSTEQAREWFQKVYG